MWRKGWECKVIQPLWRIIWRFLQKLKIKLPYNPAIPLLVIYSKKTIIPKDTCTVMFIAALFKINFGLRMRGCMLICFSHVQLCVTLWTIAHQGPLSMGFSRKEYWSGLPFPSLGDLPDPGIQLRSPASQTDCCPSEL